MPATRRVELLAVDLGRNDRWGRAHAAPGQPEVEQPLARKALPVAPEPLEVGEIDRLGRRMRLWRPIREATAQPGFPQRFQVGGGKLGAADVVAPVVDEREPAEQRLYGGQAGSLVHVVGREQLAQGRHGREVAELPLVARHAPEQRIPHVPVGVDEARQHDHIAPVDRLRAACLEAGANGDDGAVLHVHVGARHVAEGRVHRHHEGIADDDLAALRKAGRSGRLSLGERACAHERRDGATGQHRASAHCRVVPHCPSSLSQEPMFTTVSSNGGPSIRSHARRLGCSRAAG
jgi:hypothetical protein